MTVKLFLVEDHPIMRSTLRKLLLRESDFSIYDEAATAEEALEKLEASPEKPDLLLVDASLPGMSGLELLVEIHARWPELQSLILSGYDKSVYEKRALEAGAQAYLNKEAVLDIVPTIRRLIGTLREA